MENPALLTSTSISRPRWPTLSNILSGESGNARACDEQRTGQQRGDFLAVARALGLPHHADRAHAQKAEDPVYRAQYDRAHRNSPDGGGLPHLAHNTHIDRAQYRHGGVGQHDGHRDLEHPAMRDGLWRGRPASHGFDLWQAFLSRGFLSRDRLSRASGNGPSPAQRAARDYPATPRHGPRRSAAPNG